MENDGKKKKGFFSMIWESMTKSGGCCGGGESCCGPADSSCEPCGEDDDSKTVEKETDN